MKTFNELQEGVYDPNILKAFFLAGGPGSGKSYVVSRTTGGLGLKIVNSDDAFEKFLKDANLSLKMPDEEESAREPVRARAKKITKKQQSNYVEGRLGLIIDGTGKDYEKISKQARDLQQLGYDIHMVFVNTSLDTALERNKNRPRSVPESLVIKSWKEVQANIGKFSQLFKRNFVVVDNNDTEEDIMTPVYKQIMSLAKAKVTNHLGKKWIANELAKKKRR
jgi:dephospho-CoA kinase|tara:strand:- start:506 stop:1171 length:666 start_codon:yes stop_codon:yes gene_type:complete